MSTQITTRAFALAAALTALFVSCEKKQPSKLQGYVEGEYLYIAAPLSGKIQTLHVERGAHVQTGALLFDLERTAEQAARDEADQRLSQARSTLADARKGRRASELESLQAQVRQAREAMALSDRELARQENLTQSGAVAVESIDRARSAHLQNRQRVAQLEAEVKTALLGQRDDQIQAAEAEVKAREAALKKAEWDLSETQQRAPQAGLIYDTLYRPGEWVAAGRPVISLLPPGQIKVRVFVSEPKLGSLHVSDTAMVSVDGMATPLTAKISFISPQAEYTPPVIYSQENRSKLVFMVELRFDDASAAMLHPGQPVDVDFPPLP